MAPKWNKSLSKQLMITSSFAENTRNFRFSRNSSLFYWISSFSEHSHFIWLNNIYLSYQLYQSKTTITPSSLFINKNFWTWLLQVKIKHYYLLCKERKTVKNVINTNSSRNEVNISQYCYQAWFKILKLQWKNESKHGVCFAKEGFGNF